MTKLMKNRRVPTAVTPRPVAFSYAVMDDASAREARKVVGRYRGRVKACVIGTGLDLIAMKARFKRVFQRWHIAEMNVTPRTAENYMQAAKRLGDKYEIISHLPPTLLYKLAARATSDAVLASMLKLIAADKTIPPKVIDAEIDKARAAEKAATAAELEAEREAALTDEQRAEESDLHRERKELEAILVRETEPEQRQQHEQEKRDEVEAARGAAFLIDKLGVNGAGDFITNYGPLMEKVLARAHHLIAAERALSRQKPVVRYRSREERSFGSANLHGCGRGGH